MKFLCLICAEKMMEDLPEKEAQQLYAEYLDFTHTIKSSGHFVAANRLLPAATAATVRVRDGKTRITDGPFAETKEYLGGYYLIEAADLNEAINIAAQIPGARSGCVEVRPVAQDPQTLALGF